ncbi:class I SAM-dependent methyltransferase [Patescibacteria group bacterium]|nr:class I SAM-dependent methyltransferase [Patescibacteria group bacterium]MBU1967007.1 class I SAM-dependent methyltransferase [Patescibacteria group bacterium]MBU2543429.1 class I SAM-dependent methyltransferase [Patescibacteria group bacterium]
MKHMQKKSFYFYERWLNSLGLFDILKKIIDAKWIKHSHYKSDLYKYSTSQFLIRHFFGYNGHQVNHNTGNLGFGFLHYAFIIASRPERILCIGSEQGFIPAICALACKDNNKGHVDFVDAGKTSKNKNHWGGTGFWKKNNPQLHFSVLELENWITPYIMTSKQFAKKYQYKYEYIFIDGDHSYPGVKFDYETFWPRLATDGMMGFHDISLKGLNGQDEYGVWKMWKELNKKHKLSFEYLDNSVGFIQKNE